MTVLAHDPVRLRRPRPARGAAGSARHGAASLTLRPALEGPRRAARVLAVFPAAVYLELRDRPEPRVLAVVGADAVRPPNALVLAATARERPFRDVREGADAWVGDGAVDGGGLRVRVRRWWDPAPALGTVPPPVLERGVRALAEAAGDAPGGLDGHPDPPLLAGCCAAGDLAGAVEAAERVVGLGPGLTPSGDDVLAGLLVTLRLLGHAVPGGRRAVWLADWLGAAVTADADARTTAVSATLLHCAAAGETASEVAAVLRAAAGREEASPAVRRLLAVGHTSGADLAEGVLAGCRAVLALAEP
ncbi:DUF2877 domain-containing protein [Actinomadura namibiensis]|uniref:DUF2877 domain-containing protein n=1 Tax=Actinomadura namibiensis TaxID=182080 RepID=A0A7W3LSW7_ACTNM|nr:DUF2877 domain-containing protein [Actinomadura namibiensis]MBA8953595.1 hypothetical protein [Actinomadura namibiensis]